MTETKNGSIPPSTVVDDVDSEAIHIAASKFEVGRSAIIDRVVEPALAKAVGADEAVRVSEQLDWSETYVSVDETVVGNYDVCLNGQTCDGTDVTIHALCDPTDETISVLNDDPITHPNNIGETQHDNEADVRSD